MLKHATTDTQVVDSVLLSALLPHKKRGTVRLSVLCRSFTPLSIFDNTISVHQFCVGTFGVDLKNDHNKC